MLGVRGLMLVLLFCGVNCVQVSTNQKPQTILQRFESSLHIRHCNITWTNPETVPFLKKCDMEQPPPTDLTRDNSDAFLCMVYFDLNMRLCAEISKDESFKSKMPKDKGDVSSILDNLNSPEIAKDFCNTSHNEIFNMTSNITRTVEYVELFVKGMSNKVGCELTCFEYNSMLNPFCKSILWITKMLNSHRDKISNVDKLNQYKKSKPNKAENIAPELTNSSTKTQNTGSSSNEKNPISQVSLNAASGSAATNKGSDVITHQSVDTTDSASSSKKEVSPPSNNVKPPAQSIETPIASSHGNLKASSVIASPNKTSQEPATNYKISSEPPQKISSAPALIPVVKNPEPNVDNNDGISEEIDKPDFLDNAEEVQDNKLDNEQLDVGDEIPLANDNSQKQSQRNEEDVLESAAGVAGGAAPMENPINGARNEGVTLTGTYVDTEDTHFFPYFLFISGVLIVGYIIFHNKNKVLGLLLEGRKNDTRRRCPSGGPAYRKLDCTLEEAVNSAPPSHTPHIVY